MKKPPTLEEALKEPCKKWYAAQKARQDAEEEAWRTAATFHGFDPEDWNELYLEGWKFDNYDSESHCLKSVVRQIKKMTLEMELGTLEDKIKELEQSDE